MAGNQLRRWGPPMRYVLVLLAASIGWTAPAFAESGGHWRVQVVLGTFFEGCSAIIAPEPTPLAPSAGFVPTPRQRAINGLTGKSRTEFENRERRCLATAIYFEARSRPIRGQIGVGQVIMNRVRSPQFPETICAVVYQGQMEKECQFSFACDGRSVDWLLLGAFR
jgi:hypothetical protein